MGFFFSQEVQTCSWRILYILKSQIIWNENWILFFIMWYYCVSLCISSILLYAKENFTLEYVLQVHIFLKSLIFFLSQIVLSKCYIFSKFCILISKYKQVYKYICMSNYISVGFNNTCYITLHLYNLVKYIQQLLWAFINSVFQNHINLN